MESLKPHALRSFKYFIEFISIISLFCIFKIIGHKNASWLGGFLAIFIGPLLRSKKITKKNIEIGLGKIDEEQKIKIINGMWSNIGRTVSEYIFLKNFRNLNYVKISGANHLSQIKKEGKPVIFYSGHFANFELMKMELDKFGIKFAALHRPLNNFFLEKLKQNLRLKYVCQNYIPKSRLAIREVINKIKDGYSLAIMVDQRLGEGPNVPLFNQPAQTTTLPAQLALRFNCKLVPIYLERKKGINFEMTVYEPYEVQNTGNEKEDIMSITLKINQVLEKMILNNPKQWLWSHNRWKQ